MSKFSSLNYNLLGKYSEDSALERDEKNQMGSVTKLLAHRKCAENSIMC